MKLNIIASEAAKASNEKAYALFFVKESIQFSKVLSNKALDQAESVLKGMKDGPFEDLEFLEIDGNNTFFVDAAKERGLSSLDHLRMAAYRLAKKAMKKQVACVSSSSPMPPTNSSRPFSTGSITPTTSSTPTRASRKKISR